MTTFSIFNATRETCLAARVRQADRFVDRLTGLIGRDPRPGEGLLITPCRAVHTFGMRHPIDVVFLDASGRIVDLEPDLPPRRISRIRWMARSVLELGAGTLRSHGCAIGDRLIRLSLNVEESE
jgi:uncharacterized membrane protein (UPF0127 family)